MVVWAMEKCVSNVEQLSFIVRKGEWMLAAVYDAFERSPCTIIVPDPIDMSNRWMA